jgi:hypothetical protein
VTLRELVELDGSSLEAVADAAGVVAEKPFAWLLLQSYMAARQADESLTLEQVAEATFGQVTQALIAAGVFEHGDQ